MHDARDAVAVKMHPVYDMACIQFFNVINMKRIDVLFIDRVHQVSMGAMKGAGSSRLFAHTAVTPQTWPQTGLINPKLYTQLCPRLTGTASEDEL